MRPTIALLAFLSAVALPGVAAAKLHVVATTPDLGAIAAAVGGDAVEVSTLARSGEDPHFVDAKPSFIRLLNQADVLVEGGASLEEGWLPPLLDGARNPRLAAGAPGRVVASTGVALRDVPSTLDRSLGDVHPFGNPHYLLDPANAETVGRTIADAYCAVDQSRCQVYRDGAGRFAATIEARLPAWRAALAPGRGAKVVTYHRDFDYLLARFEVTLFDTLEPKPGIPPSPSRLAELVPRASAAHVRAILVEPYRERRLADFVADKTGARVVILPIMPAGDPPDYVDLMERNVRALADALGTRP